MGSPLLHVDIFLKKEADLLYNLKKFCHCLDDFKVREDPMTFKYKRVKDLDAEIEKFCSELNVGKSFDLDFDSFQLPGLGLSWHANERKLHWPHADVNSFSEYTDEQWKELPQAWFNMVKCFATNLDCDFFEIGNEDDSSIFSSNPYLFATDNAASTWNFENLPKNSLLQTAENSLTRRELFEEFRNHCAYVFENKDGGVLLFRAGFVIDKNKTRVPFGFEFITPGFFIRRKIRRKGINFPLGELEERIFASLDSTKVDELAIYGLFSYDTAKRLKEVIAAREQLWMKLVDSRHMANLLSDNIEEKEQLLRKIRKEEEDVLKKTKEKLKKCLSEQEKIDFGLE